MSTIYLFNGVIPKYWPNVEKKQVLSKRALFSVYNYIFTYYMFLGVVFSVSRCCMLSIPQRRRKIKNKRGAFTFHQFYKTLVWNLSTCLKRWTSKWTISTPRKFWQTAQNHILIRKIYFLLFFKPNFSWCPQTKSKMNFIRMFSAKFMWNAFPASENSLCKEEILLHWIFQILWLGFFGIGRCLTIFDQFKKNMIIWILKRFFITHELLLKNNV